MPNMTSYDRGDIVLAILPFSDLTELSNDQLLSSAPLIHQLTSYSSR